jgi:hypothetical protein
MAEDPVVIVPIPALVAILLNVETTNGKPLTEAEVLAIRDSAVCMTMPYSAAAAIVAKCGYDDVRPENVWEDWQAVRPSLYP